jgi:hypothetical protein
MRTEVIEITPKMAQLFLSNNNVNRKISQSNIASLASDMKEGRWQLTHQGICLGKDMALIDGQHRLKAILEADVPVKMCVTFDDNLTSPLDWIIDAGIKRTSAFTLGIPTLLSATARYLGRSILLEDPSILKIRELAEWINPQYSFMSQSTMRGISKAPVIAGAILSMKEDKNRIHYIAEQYESMVNFTPELMSPVVSSFFKQIAVEKKYVTPHQLCARAYRIFIPDNRNNQRLMIKSESFAFEEVKSLAKTLYESRA